jgi:hypothetical protein
MAPDYGKVFSFCRHLFLLAFYIFFQAIWLVLGLITGGGDVIRYFKETTAAEMPLL